MLIICTQDQSIVDFAKTPGSQSALWGKLVVLKAQSTLAEATAALEDAVADLGPDEAVCFSAHGNSDEIGDAIAGPQSWRWDVKTIATILGRAKPPHSGPILFSTCANGKVAFGSKVVVELEMLGKLNNTWVYDYDHAVSVEQTYPDPNKLHASVELHGKQVRFASVAHAGSLRRLPYQIAFPHGALLQVHSGFDARELATLLAVLSPALPAVEPTTEVTKLTNLVVKSLVGTEVLRGPKGEYDSDRGTLFVIQEGSKEFNGGPQGGVNYNISFNEPGSPKTLRFKGRFAAVGYEFT